MQKRTVIKLDTTGENVFLKRCFAPRNKLEQILVLYSEQILSGMIRKTTGFYSGILSEYLEIMIKVTDGADKGSRIEYGLYKHRLANGLVVSFSYKISDKHDGYLDVITVIIRKFCVTLFDYADKICISFLIRELPLTCPGDLSHESPEFQPQSIPKRSFRLLS